MSILKYFSFKYKWSKYVWQIIIFWTLGIFVSSFWNIANIYKTTIHDMKLQAVVALDKDIQYRSWNAKHGGVYVPVSNYGKPNPYLKGLVKRDIMDQVGDTLTMINPAYMSRQVHESELSNIGVKGHITSLNLMRPENIADEWETIALQSFNNGLTDISTIEMIDSIKYFRFMKPLMIEKGCLKCHEKQDYKIGDIRGGISISIPIESMLQKSYANMRNHGLIESFIWIIGLMGIMIGYKSVKKAEVELTKHRDHLETMVQERTAELKERIKELRFLYSTTEIAGRPGIILDKMYSESVNRIPQGWQYPEITGGCITIDGKAYKTKNFKKTKWMQSEDIRVKNKTIGSVEVCYLQEKPDEYEGPFLKEERELIKNFAEQLSKHITSKRTNKELQTLKQSLEKKVTDRTKELEKKVLELDRSEKAMLYIIEDLNQTSEQLKTEQEKLGVANKELEAFSYSVSHDLRAPLRAIDGFTRILIENYASKLDQKGKRLGSIIQDSAKKMGKLIDDLLAFSRLGRVSMTFSNIDMKNIANAIYHEMTTPKERKRITFTVAKLSKAEGDPNLIRQVWMNLISNAVKFSSHRKQAIISVTCKEEEDKLTYCIKDNGVGFNMKYVEKVFGVFQRLHSEKEFEGTGVGLALVQRIILRHGGKVWAEGEVDKGATFYFSLPKKKRWVLQ